MSPGRSNRTAPADTDLNGVRMLLGLTGLWGALSWFALQQWRAGRAGARRDEHVRRLLSGALVPVPRQSTEELDSTR
jgi:hypothetical protein